MVNRETVLNKREILDVNIFYEFLKTLKTSN